jgi:hypothetical protein
MDRVMVNLYSFRLMLRHDLNPICDIMADNFWHDLRIQYKIKGLGLRGLTCLIKWVWLKLTYIVLCPYLNPIRTRHRNMNCHPLFIHHNFFEGLITFSSLELLLIYKLPPWTTIVTLNCIELPFCYKKNPAVKESSLVSRNMLFLDVKGQEYPQIKNLII